MSNYPCVKRATDRKTWCETCMRAVQPHVDEFPEGWTGLECPGSRMSDYLSMSTVLTMTGCSYEHLCHATSNDLGSYMCEELGWVFSASEIAQWIRDGLPGIYESASSADLRIARSLVNAGLPVFVASPNPAYVSGDKSEPEFLLPKSWQTTEPDPSLLDRWEPGWAVCLVAGHGLDAVDVDPVHGGDAAEQLALLTGFDVTVLGIADTPSGGVHIYVTSTGIGSFANTKVGVDYRGRRNDGSGGGFLYLPGTQRPKYLGEGYSWRSLPDLALLDPLYRKLEQRAITDYLESLGVGVTPVSTEGASGVPGEPVDLASLPPWLQELLTDFGPEFKLADGSTSTDRSARFHHLVGACQRAGLSQGQVVSLLTTWCEGVA